MLGQPTLRIAANRKPSIPLEAALLNHSSLIAWWFTWLGYAYVLGPLCIALIADRLALSAVARARRVRNRRAAALLDRRRFLSARSLRGRGVSTGSSNTRRRFRTRARTRRSPSASTCCGRSSSAAATLPSRVRGPLALLLAAVAVGILWSRLALGAHYATDLLGGALWALAVIAAGLTAFPTKVLSPPQGRP